MQTTPSAPTVYIIAGPNGAGKTTFARDFLPLYADCEQFVNADAIAAGLSPFAPESVAFQAARIMLQRIHTLADERKDFAVETTLSGRTYIRFIHEWKKHGYSIVLFFLWLPSVEMHLQRVAERVAKGGHDIPEPVVRRRYTAGIRNLIQLYLPIVDSCRILENTSKPRLVASAIGGKLKVANMESYSALLKCGGIE